MSTVRKKGFPVGDYTPYGYLHTPTHTFLHPSGLLRSVAPLGFGWYKNGLPWYSALRLTNTNSYLLLLRPAVQIGGKLFAGEADFDAHQVKRCSAYHSANLFSYDFTADGVRTSLLYFSGDEKLLFLETSFTNETDRKAAVRYDCTVNYGMNHSPWWGSDAVTARTADDRIVAKILAYGDVAVLQGDRTPSGTAVFTDEAELKAFRLGQKAGRRVAGLPLPQSVFGSLLYSFDLQPGETATVTCVLARDVRENPAAELALQALKTVGERKARLLKEDDAFYSGTPLLRGDFPDTWKRGLVYDFETLRMNIADPVGIYKHHWDTMQPMAPRVVVAETAIDMRTLQYASPEMAKEVFEGLFADAPEVFVPCTREDGSVNMIGMDGTECGTAPLWGTPLDAVREVYENTGDKAWLARMYPMLKEYLNWYSAHRTDAEGWYHCNNSWESGQDGSVRFTAGMSREDGPVESANAEFVRTADLEAAMAQAAFIMADFARILGNGDVSEWTELAERGKARVLSMFVNGWFRDFDSRNGRPFLNTGYYDIMLSMPFALGLFTEEQSREAEAVFEQFRREAVEPLMASPTAISDNGYSLKWPPIMMTLTEALVKSGRQKLAAMLVAATANAAYARNDRRYTVPMTEAIAGVPDQLNVMIPGVAMETLAANPASAYTENYGWGALLPSLIIRSLLGIRTDLDGTVTVCSCLPENLSGRHFSVENLVIRGKALNFTFDRIAGEQVTVTVTFADGTQITQTLASGKKMSFSV